MNKLFNGDCLEVMRDLSANSIDLLFCDLPYGETSCKWDCKINLETFWKEVNRICKINCPMFFTTTARFGVELINSNPKNFRYDLVWVKSASVGFLNAKKMPMRKHELIYVFYRKLPHYDLSSHSHKFLGHTNTINPNCYNECEPYDHVKYDPPLPVSVITTKLREDVNGLYGTETKKIFIYENGKLQNNIRYDPPLPDSVIKEDFCIYDISKNCYGGGKEGRIKISKKKEDHSIKYDPPLPNSVIKTNLYANNEEERSLYRNEAGLYDPPLPNSVIQIRGKTKELNNDVYNVDERMINGKLYHYPRQLQKGDESIYDPPLPNSVIKTNLYANNEEERSLYRNEAGLYDPPLPNSILEIKSEKGKHATQKPIELIKWLLKYYSKTGDTILDPTMGSGTTIIACKQMNRNYIGIEKDEQIYKDAVERINKI